MKSIITYINSVYSSIISPLSNILKKRKLEDADVTSNKKMKLDDPTIVEDNTTDDASLDIIIDGSRTIESFNDDSRSMLDTTIYEQTIFDESTQGSILVNTTIKNEDDAEPADCEWIESDLKALEVLEI